MAKERQGGDKEINMQWTYIQYIYSSFPTYFLKGPETLKLEPQMDLNPLMQPPVEPGPETGTESGTQVAFREIMVDCAAPEAPEDSFPEPVDA